MKKLILIDGNAILHRAYHAYPPTLQTRSGELTNATYGFTSTLLNVCKKLQPTHMIVTFDHKAKNFRHKKFDGYKASRPKMDEELVSQINRTKEVVETLNLPKFELEGYEADDVLGTLARQAVKDMDEVIVVTGDKDALQLLDKKVKVFFPSRGRIPEKMYDQEKFEKEYLFAPRILIDYKALAGDSSDEIPGVKGVGPKTATDLLVSFSDLDGVYQHLSDVKETVRKKLETDKDKAYLSKDLATIRLDAPIKFKLNESVLKDYDKDKAIELFEELEFRSLIKRLPADSWECMAEEVMIEEKKEEENKNQMTLF